MRLGKTKTGLEVLVLDYEEELECARRFCQMLDLLWIEDSSKLYRPLCKMFFKKSNGLSFIAEELMNLDDEIERHNHSLKPEYAEEHGLPGFGFMEYEGETKITFDGDPANASEKQDYESRQNRSRREVARAWKEAWEERPKGWLHERFPNFPGDKVLRPPTTPGERQKEDRKLEAEFWKEVDKIQDEANCSREQAYLYVKDYMERATFTENEVLDPHPKRKKKPVIDVEVWRSDLEEELDE